MNFNLTEEQQMLQDSAARFVGQDYSFERRQRDVQNDVGFDPELWRQFADLGWLSVPFAEENGGFGGDATDLFVLMEQLGKGLVATPYLPSILLFGRCLEAGANPALKAELLERLIAGELQGALAYMERQSRHELFDVQTNAHRDGDEFVISGEKALVMNAQAANMFVVSVRTSGSATDKNGVSLLLVDAKAPGIELNSIQLMDGQKVANVTFRDVRVSTDRLIGLENQGAVVLEEVVNQAIPAICAEALGLMTHLTNTTIEYSKTRKQFGVAIGSFQVLQHRMVDMFTACEETRSLLYRVLCSAGEDDLLEHKKNLHALKVITGLRGKRVGNESIQLHGGMGITDELDVGHYVKRLMVLHSVFGDADYHQQQLARLSLPQ
ncbi:pimeloyl-CoA dehydrogenase small subunit [Marinobacter fuscus]|uniref:Pimeloyl-CoA dehydrogenase small subunit n=1 Tax=Marinobacter fuscus TaxID=2109942 RepID=A0A2T1KP79_9GAMM|nr:acyl-CoA dehydrogenase family protein [Marinobacter fuscus]PSF11961.1 pimeloyl-CoA dehydrogenase small subunit [Marinobacter fuscus]